MLAPCVRYVLPTIIDNTGGIIRDTENILYQLQKENTDYVILMLDMENTFDRVKWKWLFEEFECFGNLLLVVQTCEMQHHG